MTTDARRPIFILGAARTGTTLLQRLLNSYDDVLVWGEHAGFLKHVAQGFFTGWDEPNMFRDVKPINEVLRDSSPRESWQAWMSPTTRDGWLESHRRFLDLLFLPGGLPGKRYWGFKEIRYMTTPGERTLEFLSTLYPDAIFLFIVRNVFNAIASEKRIAGGSRDVAELKTTCERWRARYQAYRAWHRGGHTRSYWITYEDLIDGRGEVLALLDALGRPLGDAQRAVLRSGDGRGSSFKDDAFNERWRRLPPVWLAVVSTMLGDLNAELGYPNPSPTLTARAQAWLLLRGLAARSPARPAVPDEPAENERQRSAEAGAPAGAAPRGS